MISILQMMFSWHCKMFYCAQKQDFNFSECNQEWVYPDLPKAAAMSKVNTLVLPWDASLLKK